MENEANQQTQVPPAPTTLEEAMRALRSNDAPAPTGEVAAGDLGAGTDPQEAGAAAAAGSVGEGATQLQPDDGGAAGTNAGGTTGGSAAGSAADTSLAGAQSAEGTEAPDGNGAEGALEGVDYAALSNQMAETATRQAAQEVAMLFQENGLHLLSINDLYQRDEDTGRVSFANPDDPNQPFQTRQEAQSWINAYNQQFKQDWNSRVYARRAEILERNRPVQRLLQFAPTYDAMDQQTKSIFDDLIEPYEIKDNQNVVIGYSCDLPKAHALAQSLVTKFGSGAEAGSQGASGASAQGAPDTGPALDMNTSGSQGGAAGDKPDPKNISEAMLAMRAAKKKGQQ